MKNRLLAFLLCLILIVSSFLFTGCGKKKETEVTAPEERQAALAGFLRGVEALREGGIVFTGSLKGSSTKDGKESAFDLSLALNYSNKVFQATTSGIADGKNGTSELYFDNVLLATLSTEDGAEAKSDVIILDDVFGKLPALELPFDKIGAFPAAKLQLGKDGNYSGVVDRMIGLLDLDKIAERINAAPSGVLVIMKSKSNYKIIVTSDAIFDAVIATLNTVKASGEKTVGELFDELIGVGLFEQLKAELEKHSGTDKVDTLLPNLEALLSDCGINVDAVYQYAAESIGMTGENAGKQMQTLLQNAFAQMTVNDALALVESTVKSQLHIGTESAEPLTYESIKEEILSFADATLNDLIVSLAGPGFDLSAEIDAAIANVQAIKEAVKFDMTVTCDKKLNPTNFEWNASVDGTKLPDKMKEDVNFTLNVTAEVKSAVTVAPSAALQAKIDDAKAKKNDPPAGE